MAKKTQTSDTIPTTIKIPGGSATFYLEKDLPPRRERVLEILQAQLNPRKLKALRDAARILDEDGEVGDESPVLDGPDATLDAHEAELLFSLGETTAWAYLKSWTLQMQQGDATVPRPLPAAPDDFLDLPKPIYEALTAHGAKLSAASLSKSQDKKDGFTIDSVEDPDSPTTA